MRKIKTPIRRTKKERVNSANTSLPKRETPLAPQEPQSTQPIKKSFFEDWKYALAAAVIFVILLVLGAILFKPSLEQQKILWVEQSLNKTKQLSILPGEQYTYAYVFENSTMDMNISYAIKGGGECIIIDIINGTEQPMCINSKGNDKSMSNLSLNAPFLNIFRPWMLALKDGWDWSVLGKGMIVGTEYIFDEIKLTVVGKEQFKGRPSYKVKMNDTSSSKPVFLWVDDEKRILLRELGPGYEVTLIKAPFSLEQ